MNSILELYEACSYKVGLNGHIQVPAKLKGKKFKLGTSTYKVGIGGLHSCERNVAHTTDEYLLREFDVTAYYPMIILNNKLTLSYLGSAFLSIFKSIVARRIKAKRECDKTTNETLKIVINGTFGKFASKWSFLYAPDLMLQVTITGQLTLLMLIERLELRGISVISGNTDGIIVKMLPDQESLVVEIISNWEIETSYNMEATKYVGIYSRGVNDYIAISENYIKGKGAFADPREQSNYLRINPANEISTLAVKLFLQRGINIEKTIRECKDVTMFVTIRTVNGGAIKDGNYVGKAIRWYYGKNELDAIYYKKTGNKVPRSDGAKPLMQLPKALPADLDYQWYINESKTILDKIGYK